MEKILVLGLGKVGTLVGMLLNKQFEVEGVDKEQPHYRFPYPFPVIKGDVSSAAFLDDLLPKH